MATNLNLNAVGNKLVSLWNTAQAPVQPKPPPPGGEKQYLRLPVESARKLRWYDKSDVQAIIKSHIHEKRELNEAIALLKKLLLRSGMSDSELDLELSHVLARVDDIKESDEGVNDVLLMSLQSGLAHLQETNTQLQEELSKLKEEVETHQARQACPSSSSTSFSTLDTFSHEIKPVLLAGLQQSLSEFESYLSASNSLSRQIRSCEMDLNVAQATESMKALAHQALGRKKIMKDTSSEAQGVEEGGSDGWGLEESVPDAMIHDPASHMNLIGKLQRLEMERRCQAEEMQDLSEQLAVAKGLIDEAELIRIQMNKTEDRCKSLEYECNAIRSECEKHKAACRMAEEFAEQRGAELKQRAHAAASSASAETVRKYQDMCLEYEERASTAERRSALSEARCNKLETAAKEAQGQVKNLQKQLADMKKSHSEALERAEAAVVAAAKEEKQTAGASTKTLEQLQEAELQVVEVQREMSGLKTLLLATEQKLQAADAREARLMAEVRELDQVAAEREELSAQVVALREKIVDQRAERGQLEHFKQLVQELEAGRDRLQQELLVTAQLATQLEARLTDAVHRVDNAETATQVAEGRVRAAEAAIGTEVELRLNAACSNRSLWPRPIREEFDRLEQRLGSLQAGISAAQSQLQVSSDQLKEGEAVRAVLEQRTKDLETRLDRREAELHSLVEQKDLLESDVRLRVDQLYALQQECDDLKRQRNAASSALMRQASSVELLSTQQNPKWQVQNKVGGGSLFGIAQNPSPKSRAALTSPRRSIAHAESLKLSDSQDSMGSMNSWLASGAEGGVATGSHGPATGSVSGPSAVSSRRTKMEGVDIVYLKNVLFKFMEAAVTGKVAERDVLLPAVAAILQASPAEFGLLKRLFMNTTTPPAMQVLSAFGIKLS